MCLEMMATRFQVIVSWLGLVDVAMNAVGFLGLPQSILNHVDSLLG